MTMPYAAGALLSSVDDLTRWNSALASAKLMPSDLVERMWAANRLNDGQDSNYGYGWMIRDYNGKRVVEHGGGIHGFVAFLLLFPDDDLSVSILSNNPGNENNPQMLAQKAASLVMGESLDWAAVDLAPAVMERYVGVYRIDDDAERVVTLENGQLYTQRTGGALNKAYPHSETGFFYKHSLSHFCFEMDEQGAVAQMVMKPWGGKEEKALRTDKPIPEGPKAAEVDPEIYKDYVGDYELMPGFVLTVSREGEKLIGQATGQDSFEMLPQSKTEFFIREAGATIAFHRDAETGKVTDLLLSQGGMELTGKRVDQAAGMDCQPSSPFWVAPSWSGFVLRPSNSASYPNLCRVVPAGFPSSSPRPSMITISTPVTHGLVDHGEPNPPGPSGVLYGNVVAGTSGRLPYRPPQSNDRNRSRARNMARLLAGGRTGYQGSNHW
jgi:hypothetical protein